VPIPVGGIGGGLSPDAISEIGSGWHRYGLSTPLSVGGGPMAVPVGAVGQPQPPNPMVATNRLLAMKKKGPIFPGARDAPLPVQPQSPPPGSPGGSNPGLGGESVSSGSSNSNGPLSPTKSPKRPRTMVIAPKKLPDPDPDADRS
jgi:hypothetical protein